MKKSFIARRDLTVRVFQLWTSFTDFIAISRKRPKGVISFFASRDGKISTTMTRLKELAAPFRCTGKKDWFDHVFPTRASLFALRRHPGEWCAVLGRPPAKKVGGSPRGAVPMLGLTQLANYLTLKDSFSAVSKTNFASEYALESSRRDLQNALLCTVLVGSVL